MKILIINKDEWSNDNSTGNTLTNLFKDINQEDLAHLYFKNKQPNNDVCVNYYKVSDLDLMKSAINLKYIPGKSFIYNNDIPNENTKEKKFSISVKLESFLYNIFRGKNNLLIIFLQNLLWSAKKWNNQKLDEFLEDFKPDIIFVPVSRYIYSNRFFWKIKEKTNAKLVVFHGDDLFYNENNQSGFFNNYYYKKRTNAIIKTMNQASINYCISHKQQQEYTEKFGTTMKLLFKGGEFKVRPDYKVNTTKVINLVYIGSLYYGRWRTLSLLTKQIEKANENKDVKFFLKIYSQYTPSKDILKNIEKHNISKFYGKVAPNLVRSTMKEADIVLHLESFEEEKKISRLSFSTKIVDCLESGRALFAIGDENTASIDYLKKGKAALVANNHQQISSILSNIQENTSILEKYALEAWEFGRANHQIHKIRKNLYEDLEDILKEK